MLGTQRYYLDAIIYYNRALKINPNYIQALDNKGLAIAFAGNPSQAISYFDKALKINPDDVSALCNKGNELTKIGKTNDAKEYDDKAKQLKGNCQIAITHFVHTPPIIPTPPSLV